jgi:hypothetical protein
MRILSLFATVVTVVLMVHSACAQGSLLPERDYLSEPARRPRYSEESEEVADEIGQASGTELESLDVQGLSESSVLAGAPPDGDADPLALKPDPRVSKLEDRFEKLSKKFEASTAKKVTYPNFKITGFTQFDTGYYSQTDKNRSIVGDAQDGTGFRRVRLAVQGKAAELTNYQLEVDFATAGRPSFFDTYVEQESLPYHSVLTLSADFATCRSWNGHCHSWRSFRSGVTASCRTISPKMSERSGPIACFGQGASIMRRLETRGLVRTLATSAAIRSPHGLPTSSTMKKTANASGRLAVRTTTANLVPMTR